MYYVYLPERDEPVGLLTRHDRALSLWAQGPVSDGKQAIVGVGVAA
jgi:hypothetical protein